MTAAFERTHKSFDLRALRRDWPLLEARPVKVDELVERREAPAHAHLVRALRGELRGHAREGTIVVRRASGECSRRVISASCAPVEEVFSCPDEADLLEQLLAENRGDFGAGPALDHLHVLTSAR